MSTCDLDGSLIRFGAAVTEKDLVGTGIGTQPIGQCGLFRDEIQIGNVVYLLHLILNRIRQVVVVVTQCARCNPTHAIQIIFAIRRL
jgi:hypothetical protein